MILWISLSLAGGIALGLLAAIYLPFLRGTSGTSFLLKRAGTSAKTNLHLYSPAVLQGMLYVMTPVTALIAMTLREWKALPEVTEMDVKILWATCVSVAMSNWLAFVSKKWGEVANQKKKLDDETKAGLPDPNLR